MYDVILSIKNYAEFLGVRESVYTQFLTQENADRLSDKEFISNINCSKAVYSVLDVINNADIKVNQMISEKLLQLYVQTGVRVTLTPNMLKLFNKIFGDDVMAIAIQSADGDVGKIRYFDNPDFSTINIEALMSILERCRHDGEEIDLWVPSREFSYSYIEDRYKSRVSVTDAVLDVLNCSDIAFSYLFAKILAKAIRDQDMNKILSLLSFCYKESCKSIEESVYKYLCVVDAGYRWYLQTTCELVMGIDKKLRYGNIARCRKSKYVVRTNRYFQQLGQALSCENKTLAVTEERDECLIPMDMVLFAERKNLRIADVILQVCEKELDIEANGNIAASIAREKWPYYREMMIKLGEF